MSEIVDTITICPLCNSDQSDHAYKTHDLLYDKEELYDYFRCSGCGADYIWPTPTDEQIASFYPDKYMAYGEITPKPVRDLQKAILKSKYNYKHLKPSLLSVILAPFIGIFHYNENLKYIEEGKLLDIGCGNGKFMLKMRELGWQCQGIEFSPVAVEACRKNNLEVFQGELKNAGLPENSFDLVIARHVVEHLADVCSFFAEVSKVVKPDGYFHIRTPNSQALARNHYGTNWCANDAPRHLVLFSPENLTMLVEKHGFEKVEFKTLTSPRLVLDSHDYKVGNKGKASIKKPFMRLLVKPYVYISQLLNCGDELFAVYRKK